LAGQGTAGIEILEDFPDAEYIIVPIGGGGLIAGISVAAKHIKPNIKIIVRRTFQYLIQLEIFQESLQFFSLTTFE